MSGVLVVGGANLDQTAVAPRLPGAGETLLAVDYRETPGGKAANLAGAAAAWGAPTVFVGRVGDDAFGDALIAAWRADGVDTTLVRRDPAGTGLGLVFLDDGFRDLEPEVDGLTVQGPIDPVAFTVGKGYLGVGMPATRARIVEKMREAVAQWPAAIHRAAVMSPNAAVEEGALVQAGAVIPAYSPRLK